MNSPPTCLPRITIIQALGQFRKSRRSVAHGTSRRRHKTSISRAAWTTCTTSNVGPGWPIEYDVITHRQHANAGRQIVTSFTHQGLRGKQSEFGNHSVPKPFGGSRIVESNVAANAPDVFPGRRQDAIATHPRDFSPLASSSSTSSPIWSKNACNAASSSSSIPWPSSNC